MAKRNDKKKSAVRKGWGSVSITAVLSWCMKLAMLGLIPVEIYRGEYLFAFAIVLALGGSLIPSIVQRSYRITLPFELDLLITLMIFLHAFMGEGLGFYSRYWLFDNVLHLFGSGVSALLAFIITFSLHYTGKLRLTYPMIALFTVTFSMAIGGMWEILEYSVDMLFNKTTQHGLTDTMSDLIYDLLGGIISATFGMLYVRYSKPETKRRMARPIGEVFGVADRVEHLRRRITDHEPHHKEQ
ncbi:MAG: hypothetical protein IME99_08930 [Proteobacteria bacterium]|nr:hypothetical protein [Pseudomonadota bacterium]